MSWVLCPKNPFLFFSGKKGGGEGTVGILVYLGTLANLAFAFILTICHFLDCLKHQDTPLTQLETFREPNFFYQVSICMSVQQLRSQIPSWCSLHILDHRSRVYVFRVQVSSIMLMDREDFGLGFAASYPLLFNVQIGKYRWSLLTFLHLNSSGIAFFTLLVEIFVYTGLEECLVQL